MNVINLYINYNIFLKQQVLKILLIFLLRCILYSNIIISKELSDVSRLFNVHITYNNNSIKENASMIRFKNKIN